MADRQENIIANMGEFVYETTCECPICKQEIKLKSIRSSKNKLVDIEYDLNAHFEKVNPLYYEIVTCSVCGYAQLKRNEAVPTLAEAKLIKEKISSNYLGKKYHEFYTLDDAIHIHKLALLNAVVRNGTEGEKAYISLKLAWLYREAEEGEQEQRFLRQARDCFMTAYQRESMPVFELEEDIVAYLIAALSFRLEEYEETKKWIGYVLRKKDVSDKLKARAYELKSMLKKAEENM